MGIFAKPVVINARVNRSVRSKKKKTLVKLNALGEPMEYSLSEKWKGKLRFTMSDNSRGYFVHDEKLGITRWYPDSGRNSGRLVKVRWDEKRNQFVIRRKNGVS